MCLYSITEQLEDNQKEVWAWKEFGAIKKTHVVSQFRGKLYNRRQWYTDHVEFELFTDYDKPYPAGFHAFKTLKDAFWAHSNWFKLKRVKLRNVRTIGKQYSVNVLVATEMYVP